MEFSLEELEMLRQAVRDNLVKEETVLDNFQNINTDTPSALLQHAIDYQRLRIKFYEDLKVKLERILQNAQKESKL